MRNHSRPVFLIALMILAATAARSEERVEIADYKELEAYYAKLGYTAEAFQAGQREVPRAYPVEVPQRWQEVAQRVTVQEKKKIFFRAILPMVHRTNELILEDRSRAVELVKAQSTGELSPDAKEWLVDLARRYRVLGDEEEELGDSQIEELLRRVDIIPPSLALGQAAYESGYGTSRFAHTGNALFGQWTWAKGGMTPDQQRSEKGSYGVAAFKSPLDSVKGYADNLNTHQAYEPMRQKRAEFRSKGKPISGADLAGTLGKYSELGEAYVKTLQGIMKSNDLARADVTHLMDMEPVLIVPVDPQTKAPVH